MHSSKIHVAYVMRCRYAVVLNGRDVIYEAFVVSGLDFSSRPIHHLDTIFNPLRFGND